MDFEFLNQFEARMKSVGAYALLYKNSIQKSTWKNYGFGELYEQTNIIFAVIIYIMEQSLKDDPCTMDDIGNFIDNINMRWFKKELTYEQCKELADFIVNVVLCDEGKAMYFNGFNFNEGEYKEINISFIANKVIYMDDDIRRTSYFLTNDGYSLVLSTLEVESNMKLNIHEMIFRMHLDKATYDKAADEIKNIFNLIRIQLQKMQEAMMKIRQNALNYSIKEYRSLLEENLAYLDGIKKKFDNYRDVVKERIQAFEEEDINIKKLSKKDNDNLGFLKVIEGYLVKSLDEQQKIMSTHFDLKELYSKELEDISQMSLIKRFNLRSEVYDKVLKDFSKLDNIDTIFRPLLNAEIEKKYNINKSIQYQKPIKNQKQDEDEEILSFDEEGFREEENRKIREKLNKYKESLKVIVGYSSENNGISLKNISEDVKNNKDMLNKLIPTVEIFREIIIELIKNKNIDIKEIRAEKESTSLDNELEFQLNEMILEVINEDLDFRDIKSIHTYKLDGKEVIRFENLMSNNGLIKVVTCSNIYFEVER